MATGKDEKSKLVFVYNADGGAFNLLTDIAHKIFSPQTYACRLCALTHSNFGMKRDWKAFLETLDADLEFLHADQFREKYALEKIELPAIFKTENNQLILTIGAAEINRCRSLDDLKNKLRAVETSARKIKSAAAPEEFGVLKP